MIRKIIISMLTIGAILTTYLAIDSYRDATNYYLVLSDQDALDIVITRLNISVIHRHVFEPSTGRVSSRQALGWGNYGHSIKYLVKFRFKWRASDHPTEFYNSLIIMPLWVPFTMFAIYPSIVFLRYTRRRRRKRKGLCLKCGYDLRESPERCPECGLEVVTSIENKPSQH